MKRLITIIIICAFIIACSQDIKFNDLENINFIKDNDFDKEWYFAPGLNQATDSSAPYNYVNWEPVDASVYQTLPDGHTGPVYRLEVTNLFANGTFEDFIVGSAPALWEEKAPTGNSVNPTIVDARSTVPSITGKSLSLNFSARGIRYQIDLSNNAVLLDGGLAAGKTYTIHMITRLQSPKMQMSIHNDSADNSNYLWEIQANTDRNTLLLFPDTGADGKRAPTQENSIQYVDANTRFFSIGRITSALIPINAVIDSIRFVRSDQAHYLRLAVPTRSASRKTLISGGIYTFSVWVRNDTNITGNRIPARFVSIGIDPRTNSNTEITKTRPTNTTKRFFTGTINKWTQLTYSFSGEAIDITSTIPFDLVIEVGHSTGGDAYRDAGSILISKPSLTWLSKAP